MKILLHYPGGRASRAIISPDAQLNETHYTRKICQLIQAELRHHNLDTSLITDASLNKIQANPESRQSARLRNQLQSANLIISIRLNQQLNDSQWHHAKGWTSIEDQPASTKPSIGHLLTVHALQELQQQATKTPDQKDSLRCINHTTILNQTQAPAAITYNLYIDNKENARFLKSEHGMNAIVRLHTDAILEYARINE